jgi:hypothetical protein
LLQSIRLVEEKEVFLCLSLLPLVKANLIHETVGPHRPLAWPSARENGFCCRPAVLACTPSLETLLIPDSSPVAASTADGACPPPSAVKLQEGELLREAAHPLADAQPL